MPAPIRDISFSNKILIFSPEYFPVESSSVFAIKGITDNIDIVKFDMITPRLRRNLPKFDRIGKINVHRIGIGIAWIDRYILAFFGCFFAQRLNYQRNYSAVWGVRSDYGGLAAMDFKRKNPKIPFLLSLHDEDNPKNFRKKVALIDPWIKRIFNLADYIQCANKDLSNWARRMGSSKPISIIPNGINFEDFYRGPLRQFYIDDLKEALGVLPEERVIMIAPMEKKNLAKNFIKAISFLVNMDRAPLKILLYSKKSRFLRKMAQKQGLAGKIIFIENVEREKFPNYLWVSDLLIDISLNPFSTAFLEAMAAKVPILTIDNKKIPQFFSNKENGLLTDPQNYLDIADKINLLLDNDSDLRKIIIDNGEKLARDQYGYESIKVVVEKIYDSLFNKNKK